MGMLIEFTIYLNDLSPCVQQPLAKMMESPQLKAVYPIYLLYSMYANHRCATEQCLCFNWTFGLWESYLQQIKYFFFINGIFVPDQVGKIITESLSVEEKIMESPCNLHF